MEIIRLEFQGIGPFPDTHVIDFRELGESGLFLLEGPTGSGKTTILDAIVFALYGDVAGVDSSKGRIVSTMLKPDTEPFVDLTIDSSRGLLRVRRTPEYERPKLRGEGTTTSKASIKLWKLASVDDPVGAPISTNMAEASEELQSAVGLNKSQFTQTVMLPQGNFSTFLRAKPEDRRDVLQDIFGTDFYDQYARKLNELAQEHRAKTERAQTSVFDVAGNFCQLAWYDDAETAAEPIPDQVAFDLARDAMDLVGLRDRAYRRVSQLREELDYAHESATSAHARHLAASEALDLIETRNELISEVIALETQLADLKAGEPEVTLQEARLAAAERAEHVRRPLSNVQGAAEAVVEARHARADECERLTATPDADLITGEPTLEELRSQEDAARVTAGALDRVAELEAGLTERRSGLQHDRNTQVEEGRAISQGLARLEESHIEAQRLTEELEARATLAATLEAALEHLAGAKRRRDAAGEVVRLDGVLDQTRDLERQLSEEYQQAVGRHDVARNRWLGSLAGELACELTDGAPCPVCGSEAHPAPASRPRDFVGREEVEALSQEREEVSRKLNDARALTDRVARDLELQTELTEGIAIGEAEADFVLAQERRQAAWQAGQDAATLRSQIEDIRQETLEDERELGVAAQRLAATRGLLDEKERALAADEDDVKAQAAGFPSVIDRRKAFLTRADNARTVSRLIAAEEQAETELARCTAELTTVLTSQGFTSIDDAHAAMLDESERGQLRDVTTMYREGVARTKAQRASDRYAGLEGASPEDATPARLAKAQAEAELRDADRHAGQVQGTVNAAEAAIKDLVNKIDGFVRLREEAGPVLRMANLANAGEGNLQRVTLPTYVVLRRFEEVVDLANVRLDAMTGGRYELRRTDEQEGRSRRLGLGLVVVDHQARDTTRDPKTFRAGRRSWHR